MEYVEAKDPADVVDYTLDWSDVLSDSETITTSTWTVPTGITKDSDSEADTTTTIFLSGGTAPVEYLLTNKIVTNNATPRTYEKSIIVPVIAR